MAILGSVVYPPAMGFMSVTIGLTAAMLGNVLLAFAGAAALIAFGRVTRRPDLSASAHASDRLLQT